MISRVGSIEMAYDDVGEGPPIVFLHGFPHNRSLWLPQLSALAGTCRCIAPDLRGFGDSTVSGPWTMTQYAQDVVGLLDVLNIPKVVVCGLSMGGYVAFELWRRAPDRIQGLILADTKATADNAEAKSKRLAMIDVVKQSGSGAVADAQITGMVGKSSRERNPGMVEDLRQMMSSAPADGVAGALHALMERPDSTQTLASISVPTLIIVGEEDALTPPKESRAMGEQIRGSSVQVIESAGHVSNLERPAAFNHLLNEFMERINS
jgi:pimeloyl-ACP methyl ester carboxylesterase